MAQYKLAFMGFGNVGKALARLLIAKRAELADEYGIEFLTTGIFTGRHGAAINPKGLDFEQVLDLLSAPGQKLDRLSLGQPPSDGLSFIRACGADVLFENSPVSYHDGQPAVDYIRVALENGMHTVTANKGPVVHAYHELADLAKTHGRKFYFESAVMDGAPIFSLFRSTLPVARLRSLYGVLNSTTNMILTKMEGGASFEQAVAYCQQIGIAETDPSGDIDGWDAAIKVAALTTVLMGEPLKPQQVKRTGIRSISPAQIQQAAKEGKRWKLVCSATRDGDQVIARVQPELVGPDSPLYAAEGTTSIVQFETDVLGKLSILEENPGPHTTAYGCLADFINAIRDSLSAH
jgi:homoserine dehydrogenase